MPEGSLQLNISLLEQALSGVASLVGNGQTGVTGAASVSAGGVQVTVDVQVQTEGLFDSDLASLVNGLLAVADRCRDLDFSSIQGLDDFAGELEHLDGVFNSDLITRVLQLVATLRGLAQGVPTNPNAVIEPLVAQLLEVLRSLGGEEAERIAAWIESLAHQLETYGPLIEEARNAPNPAEILLRVVGEALSGVLQVFDFRRISAAFAFLDGAPGNLMPQLSLDQLSLSFDLADQRYVSLMVAANGSVDDLNLEVAAYLDELHELRVSLRPVLGQLRRIREIEILQPGALERRLRYLMDQALGVRVYENQQIGDPYAALLDRIDAAVSAIDLSFVRNEVLGFFERTRQAIEGVDIPSIGGLLDGQLSQMEQAATSLGDGVGTLLSDLEQHLDQLLTQLRELLAPFGSFQPDNSFRYNFQDDLNAMFMNARQVIAGPEPSLKSSLDQMQQGLDAFLGQLTSILQPVVDASDGVIDDAVAGIQAFSSFLQGLDVPAMMAALAQKLDEILTALAPIDFAPVIDPIVAELEANRDALAQVDAESLNDLLRAALSEALNLIANIDFTVTISTPLVDEFAQVKALPAAAIQYLQDRYEEALGALQQLSPTQLLEALMAAFEVIRAAVDRLSVEQLLEPLDDLHKRYLIDPVMALRPSTLLAPVSQGFSQALGNFDGLSGQSLLAPLVSRLDQVKASVAALDLTAPLDELLALLDRLKSSLAAIRPSTLLAGLAEAFTQLETELDRFKPSVVFAPVAQLAQPLLEFLEQVQQETVTALHALFQEPLRLLERLNPESITREIQAALDAVLALLRAVNPTNRFNQLKARHFDLRGAVQVGGVSAKVELVALIDPQVQLGEYMAVYNELIGVIEDLKRALELPDLAELYTEFQERLLGMLPPYARAALDVETFRRVMRLADPTRFLAELDTRFETIKGKLLVIDPETIGAELDATYDTVLGLLDNADLTEPVNRVKAVVDQLKGVVQGIRVDFVADDLDRVIGDFRALLEALDPAALFAGLDAAHDDLVAVVDQTKPSVVLAGLAVPLGQVQQILANLDPENRLKQPLDEAWQAVLDALAEVDFTVALQPLVARLDALEIEFVAGLRRVENAFDDMLRTGSAALGGGGLSASVSVSVGGG